LPEPTGKPKAAPDQESGPQGSQPSEPQAAAWPGLGQIVAGLAGVGVLVSGGAFLMGWRYVTAFYGRLGVPSRALDFQPADYFTAKIEIWYTLAGTALVVLVFAAVIGGVLPALEPARLPVLWLLVGSEFYRRSYWLVNLTVGVMSVVWGAAGLALTDNQRFLYVFATGAAWLLVGAWGIMRESPRWAPPSGVVVLVLASVIVLLSLEIVAPQLGRQDAEAILRGSEDGTAARFLAVEPLGLPGERYESDVYVTESVGVVKATDDAYFVVVRGTKIVYCLPASRVLRIEYTPD